MKQHALNIGGRFPARQSTAGTIFIELGASLTQAGYYPTDDGTGTAIRKYLGEGPLNWVRRRLKNAFTILDRVSLGDRDSTDGLAMMTYIVNSDPKPDWCFIQTVADPQDVANYAGVAAALTTFQTNMTTIVETLIANGIRPIFAVPLMANHWQPFQYKYFTAVRNRAWMQDYAKKHRIPLLNECPPTARPAEQQTLTVTTMSRTANVVTVVVTNSTAAGWATGDYCAQGGTIDAAFQLNYGTGSVGPITAGAADTWTYAHTGADGSATNKGTLTRSESITDLVKDGTHLSHKGASKVALVWEPILDALFPQVDDLSDTEGDYWNVVGAGQAATTDTIINRGMVTGTGGTKNGTAVSHTGSVADGWTSNASSGNPTSIVCSKVTRTEPGYTHQEWQQFEITAASGANAVHFFIIQHALPANWATATVKALGNWVKPTSQNSYFYVCVVAGTTHASTEPVWPTLPGQTITDNTVTWECRVGYKSGDKVVLMAEYRIQAMSDADAIMCLAFGLHDNSDDNESIADFDYNDLPADAPLYQIGENGYFCTPEATITTASNTQNLAFGLTVKAAKTATVRYTRVTWRNLSL